MDLAPVDLTGRRVLRYHGDDQAVRIECFTAADRRVLQRVYDFVQGLFEIARGDRTTCLAALGAIVARQDFATLFDEVANFGISSYAQNPSTLLAEVIHDIRGGGLTALLGNLELWQRTKKDPTIYETLFFLTRDHLKIMRNGVHGLDDVQRQLDFHLKLHDTDLIVEKWNQLHLLIANEQISLEAECPRPVPIAECCVEFGAIDRILYNLLNNAARHTADHRVKLILFPVPGDDGPNLRFVMRNALRDADRACLQGRDLRALFAPGYSTTGSGLGLAVACEFVANAYGLTPREAVDEGYLGARLLDEDFVIWFHWPIVPGV